ncbi:OmpA family protein [Lampropedia aestuarii]|nr:OmpA family protein [Lampropedia aestuarii]MDH5857385.1 OmpA family protein [Lampropedia aestuarii]
MYKLFAVAGMSLSLCACALFEQKPQEAAVAEEVVQTSAVDWQSQIPPSEKYSVVRTDRGLTIRSDAAATFRVGRADLLEQSAGFFDEVAVILNETVPADKQILIAGHTDNVGAKSTNVRLSLKRAEAVMAALSSRGVDASRMQAKGFGFDEPIADNRTKEGQALNRRVEITILGQKASPQCRCMAFE